MNPQEAREQRIWLLLKQGRVELAEQELRLCLADHPDTPWPHAQLALCLSHHGRHQEAHQEALTAIGLEPDNALNHYVQSVVLAGANCLPEAEAAIEQAICLDQSSAVYFGQLANVHIRRQHWDKALAAAELGLQIDPAHDDCANLRSMALIRLGRRAEATDTLREALQRDPDDAWTHANLGWSLIEQGQYANAMEHFREALRLEPDLEHARLGMITALKARHALYRPLLRYFLWTQSLNDRYAVALMIGAYLLFRFLGSLAAQNPEWSLWITPLLIVYIVFAVSSWLGNPLFNLVLFTNRFGRLALSNEERWTAMLVAGTLSLSLLFLVASVWYAIFLLSSLGILLATLPLSKVFDAESGWPRWAIAGLGLTVALMSISPVTLVSAVAFPNLVPAFLVESCLRITRFCLDYLGFAAIGSQLLSQRLVQRRPRRISI